MTAELRIRSDARFQLDYSVEELRRLLAPFITAVADAQLFAPTLEHAVREAAEMYPEAAAHFIIEPGRIRDTFALAHEHLFNEHSVTRLRISVCNKNLALPLPSWESVRMLHDVLQTVGSGLHPLQSAIATMDEQARSVLQQLESAGVFVTETRESSLAGGTRPAIHRLQHASVLYRAGQSGVLVDPHLHSSYRSASIRSDIYRDQLTNKVDAILISHCHEDHFSLASLLTFPLETPIVVPKVPRSSIICPNLERMLRSSGFRNVIVADWHSSPLIFGDIRVHALPFYGEQPLRFELPSHADLRNWGNTYLVETDSYLSWVLGDSGADVSGSMEEVAHFVKNALGRVDFVVGRLRRCTLDSPFYINGGLNWLTLSPSQVRDFRAMRSHSVTLGPAGVAAICRIVDARHYLPYSSGWGELGAIPRLQSNTVHEDEASLLRELESELHELSPRTKILPWAIGDSISSNSDGAFSHLRIATNSAA